TDLLFLVDTTHPLKAYLDAVKQQIKSTVAGVKRLFVDETTLRIAVVGYKDHRDKPHIQFQDFTTSVEGVLVFLNTLTATRGDDYPEDVLGAVQRATKSPWQQQTREHHGLTYNWLIHRLVKLNINYIFLRITAHTDRMAAVFAQVYAGAGAGASLLPDNYYSEQVNNKLHRCGKSGLTFPELNLGN
ncbi:uncharacterized protein PODANS_1_1700, partial [Podospora anserina S mat+]